MGTLTVGGDDIDFPGILANCILEGFPPPLNRGMVSHTCDEQRAVTWSLICRDGDKDTPNPALVATIDSLIKKIVQYGQNAVGQEFKLYVISYGQFFNDADPGCNNVTFARTANPNPDGQPHTLMTTELRQDFNWMTITLNAAIKQAVTQNADDGVTYIDIDGADLPGHRFCEPGIQEPDQNNPNLWYFHYPYNVNDGASNPTIAYLGSVAEDKVNTLTWNETSTLWVDYIDELWSKVDEDQLLATMNAPDNVTADYDIWPGFIGPRVKIFHPQIAFHDYIYKEIIAQYLMDTTLIPGPPPEPSPPPPPAYATGTCHIHVDEYQACGLEASDLSANATMYDNNGNIIYSTPPAAFANNGQGTPINVGDGATIQGPLPIALAITGEHMNDYIQFTYGGLSWNSTKDGNVTNAYCVVGSWDPKQGPYCSGQSIVEDQAARKQMECYFAC